jgi:hypothetical protein
VRVVYAGAQTLLAKLSANVLILGLRSGIAVLPVCLLAQDSPPPQPGTLASTVPPFTVVDKFDYRVVQTFGLRGLVGPALGAAFGQGMNTPSKWGQGVEGYSKRYLSGFTTNLSRQVFAFGLESTLHEDPRYFPSAEKGFRPRLKSVLRQTYMTHTDTGQERFAYSRFASAYGAAFMTNAWMPHTNNSIDDGIMRGSIIIGTDAAYNFLQEFLPFTRPRSIRRHTQKP